MAQLQALLLSSEQAAAAVKPVLKEAAQLASLVKNDEAWITQYSGNGQNGEDSKRPPAPQDTTTGGHSNTNHIIPWICGDRVTSSGGEAAAGSSRRATIRSDVESNRVRELLRNAEIRKCQEQPEWRTDERWDKPRLAGERRRRIVRDKDAPEAPHEAPPSGYVIFVGLMTTKFRHDRGPEAQHHQAHVVQEISRLWRNQLSAKDQQHYHTMSEEIRSEYQQQVIEFRATNTFRPSERFVKLADGQGPWVHMGITQCNALEREVAAYDTVVFPPRPPSRDKEYQEREEASRLKRKRKLQMEAQQRRLRKAAVAQGHV
jgi:hypothetical protein